MREGTPMVFNILIDEDPLTPIMIGVNKFEEVPVKRRLSHLVLYRNSGRDYNLWDHQARNRSARPSPAL